MRKGLLAVLLLGGFAFSAYAEDVDLPSGPLWKQEYSLEVGMGIMPLHMAAEIPDMRAALADKGQEYSYSDSWYPAFSISFNWRPRRQTEFAFTAGFSWNYRSIVQYSVFGTDPSGKPRYDLDDGKDVGRKVSLFTPTLTVQYRHFWTPDRTVQWYSGIGLGLVPLYQYPESPSYYLVPLPAITPFGMRCGKSHFYFFLEHTYSPVATLVQGGFGWRF